MWILFNFMLCSRTFALVSILSFIPNDFVWILFNFLLHARFFPIPFYAFHAQFEWFMTFVIRFTHFMLNVSWLFTGFLPLLCSCYAIMIDRIYRNDVIDIQMYGLCTKLIGFLCCLLPTGLWVRFLEMGSTRCKD